MKRKIIVPEIGFFRTYRDYLMPADEIKSNDKWKSPFQDPNLIYVINVNSKSNKKHRMMDRLSSAGGIFQKLDIKGDIEVNITDVQHFDITYRPEEIDPIYGHSYYSNSDILKCNKLTINNLNGTASFNVYNGIGDIVNQDTLKELEINALACSCSISNLPNLKKIVINNSTTYKLSDSSSSYYYNHNYSVSSIKVSKCQNLELIDISKIKDFNTEFFNIKDINPNCKMLFNRDTKLCYDIDDPTQCSSLKKFAELKEINRFNHKIQKTLMLKNLFPEHEESPLEITFKELQYRLIKYANQEFVSATEKSIKQEQSKYDENYKSKSSPKKIEEKKIR